MIRARWWFATPALAASLGCNGADFQFAQMPDIPVVARGQAFDGGAGNPGLAQGPIATVQPPATNAPASPSAAPVAALPAHPVLSVTLDSVLQLAEQQNPQMALARERVNQAYAEKELAEKRWLPEVNVGTGYYRHEGGIQDQTGTLVRSSTGGVHRRGRPERPLRPAGRGVRQARCRSPGLAAEGRDCGGSRPKSCSTRPARTSTCWPPIPGWRSPGH